jgi:hypothetical protein
VIIADRACLLACRVGSYFGCIRSAHRPARLTSKNLLVCAHDSHRHVCGTPAQIKRLDADALVDLMRRLLHAEARATGLPLSGIHVPAQINVPDGGEDGRIVWEGGSDRTDYLPRRHTALQAKATDVTATSLRTETQTSAATKGRRNQKAEKSTLRPVLVEAIAAGGAHIVCTTESLTPKQKGPLLAALRAGIEDAGYDPSAIAIDIYDGNKLAVWATHPRSFQLWSADHF